METTNHTPRQQRDSRRRLYKAGAWISDEIDVAVAVAVYSRPTGSLIPMFHRVEGAERGRVVASVIHDLAKEHGVARRMMKLCYDYFLAVGRLRNAVGARKAELLLSYWHQLGIRQVIALSRRSAKSIVRELESVKHQSP